MLSIIVEFPVIKGNPLLMLSKGFLDMGEYSSQILFHIMLSFIIRHSVTSTYSYYFDCIF